MKPNEKNPLADPTSAETSAICAAISKASVEAGLEATAKKLGMAKTVSSNEYGLLIAGSILHAKADVLSDMAFMRAFTEIWVHLPKNPSAARQALFERKEEAKKTIDWTKLATGGEESPT